MTYEFRIIQDGLVVAGASSSRRSDALAQALHYAMNYGQSGPVEIQERAGPRADWRSLRPAKEGEKS